MTSVNQPIFDAVDDGHVSSSGRCGRCHETWPCAVITKARKQARHNRQK